MNYHGWLHNIGMLQMYREALKMQVYQRKFVFLLHIQSAALHLQVLRNSSFTKPETA